MVEVLKMPFLFRKCKLLIVNWLNLYLNESLVKFEQWVFVSEQAKEINPNLQRSYIKLVWTSYHTTPVGWGATDVVYAQYCAQDPHPYPGGSSPGRSPVWWSRQVGSGE
jgi:hypothetical protein